MTGTAPQADFHRPPTPVLVSFIDGHKARFGVAPICRVLSEHGCTIAPSTYYGAKARGASARRLRDDGLKVEIARVHGANYGVYGPRKVWLQLNREGIGVARCTVERLMGALGLRGIRRGKRWTTTIADPAAVRPADLVKRRFNPPGPNRLWVADFERHEALSNRVGVGDLHRWAVAAAR